MATSDTPSISAAQSSRPASVTGRSRWGVRSCATVNSLSLIGMRTAERIAREAERLLITKCVEQNR